MSFLRDYLDYSTGNEAPELFHVWGAYACLSVATSRKTWLPFEDTAIYPNLYVMYVGAAGNGKSWAMQKAKRLLAELPDVHISGSLETPPGLWRFMNGDDKANPPIPSPVAKPVYWPDGVVREIHPMTIIANEFINFISLDDKGWINALNDIYDEDMYRYRTKNMGEDVLIGPYIVLLGALTTEVSSDLQKARIISTGLARRTLFQYGERQWHNPHSKPTFNDAQKAARSRAKEHLKKIQKIAGAFVWTPEIDEYWKAWYDPHLASVPNRPPQTQGWFSTKPIQVLKIAMLTALGERGDLTLCVSDFEIALAYLESLESDLGKIFGGVGRNELAAVSINIFEYLSALSEPITYRELKARFFSMCKPPNEFAECIQYLKNDNKVVHGILKIKLSGNPTPMEQEVVATPQCLEAFVQAHGVAVLSVEQAQLLLHPGTASVADPSPAPVAARTSNQTGDPIVVESPNGTSNDQSQTPHSEVG